ncbi:MAG: GIY-YIG nuclease family protein [Bacteroidota bacterium]
MKKYTVYILYSKSAQKFYVGHTNDINERLIRHNTGQNISTKNGAPWILVYHEKYSDRSMASKRELKIKKRGAKRFLEDIGFDFQFIFV